MSEAKALILLATAIFIISGAVTVACIKVGASGYVIGLIFSLFCAAGGYFSSLVVTHYGERKKRHKREEILLSR